MQNPDIINRILEEQKINFNVGDFVFDKRLSKKDKWEEKMGINRSIFEVKSFGLDPSRGNELIVIVIDSSNNRITFDTSHLGRINS